MDPPQFEGLRPTIGPIEAKQGLPGPGGTLLYIFIFLFLFFFFGGGGGGRQPKEPKTRALSKLAGAIQVNISTF